eukprot:535494_1
MTNYNPHIAAYSAIAMGGLHLFLAARMSMGFRIPIGLEAMKRKEAQRNDTSNGANDKDKNDTSIVKSNAFKIASKLQLNIAEYSGVYIPMLLYIQSEMNRNKKLSKIGLYSIYGTVISTYTFAFGFATVKSLKSTNVAKFIGAGFRYVSIAGLLYEIYSLTKN